MGITRWNPVSYIVIYAFFLAVPIIVIILGVKYVRLRKRTNQPVLSPESHPADMFQKITRVVSVAFPVVFLAGECSDLIWQRHLSMLYAVPVSDKAFYISVILRIIYAILFFLLITLIGLVHREKVNQK